MNKQTFARLTALPTFVRFNVNVVTNMGVLSGTQTAARADVRSAARSLGNELIENVLNGAKENNMDVRIEKVEIVFSADDFKNF